jgi:acetyl esterase/lipase
MSEDTLKNFYDKINNLTSIKENKQSVHSDVAYGVDVRQKLDIYCTGEKNSNCPVFVFFHGGGFTAGDRSHYGYVASPFVKNGVITVIPSYRLAPKHTYPDPVEDVQNALAWIHKNIKSFGGNPNRIFIGGHSAGAILAVYVSLKTDWLKKRALPLDLIKGCVPISAVYDLRMRNEAYLSDANFEAEASPLFNINNDLPYMLVAVGSNEIVEKEDPLISKGREPLLKAAKNFVQFYKEYYTKIEKIGARDLLIYSPKKSRGITKLVVLKDKRHLETVIELGKEESTLFQEILKMINTINE